MKTKRVIMLKVTVYTEELLTMIVYAIAAFAAFAVFAVILLMVYSKKSLPHLIAELRYEMIYNYLGAKALLEDIVLKEKNVVGEYQLQCKMLAALRSC